MERAIGLHVRRSIFLGGRPMLLQKSRGAQRRREAHLHAKFTFAHHKPSDRNLGGGDFAEVTRRDAGSVTFILGDTSAKGIKARQHADFLRSSYRRGAARSSAPAAIVTMMNADYVSYLQYRRDLDTFASVFVATFSPTGRITYASAGAPPALIMIGMHGQQLRPTGIILGFDKDQPYGEGVAVMHPGDMLVAFTDGIIECSSPISPDRMLGRGAIAHAIHRRRESALPMVAANVMNYAAAYCDDRFRDDASVLVCAAGVG